MDPVMLEEIKEMIAPLLPLEPGSIEYTTPGIYTFVVPAKCYNIHIEGISAASGAGGGGSGGGGSGAVIDSSSYLSCGATGSDSNAFKYSYTGKGGSGGAGGGIGTVPVKINADMDVEPGQTYTITIGSGGAGGKGQVESNNGGNSHKLTYDSFSQTVSSMSNCTNYLGKGSNGISGSKGEASEATIFGDNIIIFPSSVANNGGSGGNASHTCSACKINTTNPYCEATYDNAPNGSVVASNNTVVKCSCQYNASLLKNVTVTEPSITINTKTSGSGGTNNKWKFISGESSYHSGGSGGNGGGASQYSSNDINNDTRLAPALGGAGGSGGQGASYRAPIYSYDANTDTSTLTSPEVFESGKNGSRGTSGSKGRDGYIKISWG